MVKDPVTVVIATYNRRAELLATLDHYARSAEHSPVMVVDNGSCDGTLHGVRARFPWVEVIALKTNLGAAARNLAIRRASTAFVALSDDDTRWAPGSLSRAAALLNAHPRLALVSGRVLVGPERREDPTCSSMAKSALPSEIGMPGRPIVGFLAGASVVRRCAFLEVGGFEARFFLGGEEALVALDLLAAGWKMAYVDDVIVYHRPSRRRDVPSRERLLHRNALWLTWLRRPYRSAVRETLRLAGCTLKNPRLSASWLYALSGLPWVLKNRRVIPTHVEAALRQLDP